MHCVPMHVQLEPNSGVIQVQPTQVQPLAAGRGICRTIDQEACVQDAGIGLVDSRRCGERIERSLAMSLGGERWLLAAAFVGSIHRQSITMLQGGASSMVDVMIAKPIWCCFCHSIIPKERKYLL
jgi:hypothetical protein